MAFCHAGPPILSRFGADSVAPPGRKPLILRHPLRGGGAGAGIDRPWPNDGESRISDILPRSGQRSCHGGAEDRQEKRPMTWKNNGKRGSGGLRPAPRLRKFPHPE